MYCPVHTEDIFAKQEIQFAWTVPEALHQLHMLDKTDFRKIIFRLCNKVSNKVFWFGLC